VAAGLALALPLLGFGLLLAEPSLDLMWAHEPSHFWLVLAVAALSSVLAYGTGVAAQRRADVRVFVVSLAYLASAGFLGLHALATPGVLLETTNPGFAMATPVGLTLGALFAALSCVDVPAERSQRALRAARVARWVLLVAMAGWAVASLAKLPPLDGSRAVERASGPLVVLAVLAIALYAVGGTEVPGARAAARGDHVAGDGRGVHPPRRGDGGGRLCPQLARQLVGVGTCSCSPPSRWWHGAHSSSGTRSGSPTCTRTTPLRAAAT
jgi:hypothetical protein